MAIKVDYSLKYPIRLPIAHEMPPTSVLGLLSPSYPLRHHTLSPRFKLLSQKALKSPPQFPTPGTDSSSLGLSNSSSNLSDTLARETGPLTSSTDAENPALMPDPFSPEPASPAPEGLVMCYVCTTPHSRLCLTTFPGCCSLLHTRLFIARGAML